MKLGTMLEVNETFTTIWLSRSSEVRVKVMRWSQSPFWTIFTLSVHLYIQHDENDAACCMFLSAAAEICEIWETSLYLW